MANFFDDFNRANGALGGDWVTDYGTPAIVGGNVSYAGRYITHNSTITDGDYQEAVCHIYYVGSTTAWCGPAVKTTDGGSSCYVARLITISSTVYFELAKMSTVNVTYLTQQALGETPPPYVKLAIKWDHGHLTAVYNDTTTIEADDSTYSAGPFPGIAGYNTTSTIADAQLIAESAVGLAVDPDVIGNYGETTELALTGTNTAWTAGTPGTPTFTVNHGTITAQEVTDTSHAAITYDPGNYLGAIVFTDPSTGATAGAVVTSDPGTVNPGGLALSQTAIDYIERSAAAETNAYILNTTTLVGGVGEEAGAAITLGDLRLSAYKNTYTLEGYSSTAKLLYLLYGVLTGFSPLAEIFDAPTTTTSVKQDTEQSLDLLATLTDQGTISLVDALAQLGGDPIASNRDIMTAIAAIEGGDNQDVLDALAVIRGDESTTLAGIATLVQELATIAGYDLGDVLDAVALIPTNPITSLSPVTDKLALIQPSNSITLSSISLDVGSVAGDLADLALEVAAVKEIVEDILAALASGPTPPVWPGLANVTLGTEVALSNGLEITGPMDGVVITITSQPVQAGRYRFGSVSSWTHVGALMFGSDRGDYERPESFSIDTQVVCPRTMQSAASCIIRLNSGWAGTIQPWTRGT